MYPKNAALDHLPSAFITESATPARAAVVATPIRKLCPELLVQSTPTDANVSHTFVVKCALVWGL